MSCWCTASPCDPGSVLFSTLLIREVPPAPLVIIGSPISFQAAKNFKTVLASEADLTDRLLIVSSDFKRAQETAEIIHTNLLVKEPIRFETSLRERSFGSLDMENVDAHCQQIWALDEADPTHNEYGIESVMEMVYRMSQIIQKLDKEYNGRVIIMVSHGDPSQCIHSVFAGMSPNEYRKSRNGIKNCEIRELKEI